MLTGAGAGYAGGAVLNKIKRYTGTHRNEPQAPTIQIVMPPSSQVVSQVQDAIKGGSAVAHTVGIFTGIAKHGQIMGDSLPKSPMSVGKFTGIARPGQVMGSSLSKSPMSINPMSKPPMGAGMMPKLNLRSGVTNVNPKASSGTLIHAGKG